MGPILKMGGCRVGGVGFQKNVLGTPSNKANFLAVLEG